MAVEAGWPGLLVGEEHGGAGLGAFDAMLVAEECGRVLASVPLLGLLPASAILDAAGDESLEAVASGELRPAARAGAAAGRHRAGLDRRRALFEPAGRRPPDGRRATGLSFRRPVAVRPRRAGGRAARRRSA